jgi:uncharacterized protein DUF5130
VADHAGALWRDDEPVIGIVDLDRAEADLAAGELACPGCGGCCGAADTGEPVASGQVLGEVIVGTGRISAPRSIRPVLRALPFSRSQLAALDDVLVQASRRASVHFGVYLGDLGVR